MLFRRRRTQDTNAQTPVDPEVQTRAGATDPGQIEGAAADAGTGPDAAPQAAPEPGPWDASAAPAGLAGYTDLGYLRLPEVEGMQVSGSCDAKGMLMEIDLAIQDVSMNLMLLASARSQDLWADGYRADFLAELKRTGYACADVDYPAGEAIRALPPAEAADVPGAVPLQVEGYAGRGWMLRVVYRGSAVTDPRRLHMLRDVARRVVVTRSPGLFTPGSPLPLSTKPLWNGGADDSL